MGLRRQCPFDARIEDHDIGITARRDRALAREQPKHLGGCGRDQFDETVQGDPAGIHAAVEDQREAVFHAGQAVGDLGEVAPPQILLAFEVEWTVVGRDQLQVVLEQTLPELVVMLLRSQRRRAYVLRAFEAGPGEVIKTQVQILGAGLGKGGGAVVASLADGVERLFRAQVHDIDGHLGQARQRDRPAGGLALH